MKRMRAIIVSSVLLMAVTICGCVASEAAAKKEFINMMDAFKSCDMEVIDDYYSFSAVTNYIDEVDGEEYREAILHTLSKLDYKINSVRSSNDTAVIINADITTLDFSEIINNYIEEVIKTVKSKEYQLKVRSMSAEEYKTCMAEKMVDAINKSAGKTVTKNVDIMMVKSGDRWVLGGEADVFLGALFADISNAVHSLT